MAPHERLATLPRTASFAVGIGRFAPSVGWFDLRIRCSGPRWGPFKLIIVFGLLACVTGCPSDDGDDSAEGGEPDFPADYASSYTEVRNCRPSGDHDLNNIRILAGPSALEPYQGRALPFPVDAVVLKEEYDFGDLSCTGPIKQWTVMRKLEPDSSPDTLDWAWQEVDLERHVGEQDGPTCIGCHQGCGNAPEGYDGTCAVP